MTTDTSVETLVDTLVETLVDTLVETPVETTMKTTGNFLKILLSPVKSVKKLLVLEFWAQSQWVMLMQQTLQ